MKVVFGARDAVCARVDCCVTYMLLCGLREAQIGRGGVLDETEDVEGGEDWGQPKAQGGAGIVIAVCGALVYVGVLLKQWFVLSDATQGALWILTLASLHILLIGPVLVFIRDGAATRRYTMVLIVVTGFVLVGVALSPVTDVPEKALFVEAGKLKDELGGRKLLELNVRIAADETDGKRPRARGEFKNDADRKFTEELYDIVSSGETAYEKERREIRDSVSESRRKDIMRRLGVLEAQMNLMAYDKKLRKRIVTESWIHYLLAMFGLLLVLAGVARDERAV